MAMPPPPPKPPSRPGNSQQVIPHDVAQQRARSKEMHPAVQEAMARYASIWEENDELRTENGKLQKENEVLRKLDADKSGIIDSLREAITEAHRVTDKRLTEQEAHYRERLAEAERAKERYLRYAVSISERILSCIADLQAANDTAMEMAHTPGDKVLDDVQRTISQTVAEGR